MEPGDWNVLLCGLLAAFWLPILVWMIFGVGHADGWNGHIDAEDRHAQAGAKLRERK